jgi:outer membrane protein TolC
MSSPTQRVVSIAFVAALCFAGSTVDAQQTAPAGGGISIPAPSPDSPFLGGVSTGAPSGTPLPLSLADAIKRGLDNNLGVLLQESNVTTAHGERWQSLSGLLPDVSARVGEARRKASLAEFGFTEFPGITSTTIGPFNVFDTRLDITQPLIDISAMYDAKAGAAGLRAAKQEVKNARELVVLVVANLYLNAVSAAARVDAVRAELTTADALYKLAADLKQSGLAAGIDVLRAQVQQQTNRQRLILAENEVAKAHLQIARAIGLPPGQAVTLVDRIPYAPLDRVTLDQALERAYANRGDYLAAQAQLAAAQASHKAAETSLLPRLSVTGEVGRVGTEPSTTDFIYGIAGSVTIPVFERGRQQARMARTDGELHRRQSELADLRARIDLEVRSALLDVNAAQEALDAAKTGLDLANQQLVQSRDRFGAGVAGNIEVVQSQEAVARATDSYIAALYAHNLSKAALARAAGVAETAVLSYLGGAR